MFPESGVLGAEIRMSRRGILMMHMVPGRAKSARVINYEEFKKALEELATKRFKGKSKEEAFDAICQLVAGKEPANLGVTVRTLIALPLRGVWGVSAGVGVGRMGQVPSQVTLWELCPNRKQKRVVLWTG